MAEHRTSSSKMLKWLRHPSDMCPAACELLWEAFGVATAAAMHIVKPPSWEGAEGLSTKRGQASCAVITVETSGSKQGLGGVKITNENGNEEQPKERPAGLKGAGGQQMV